MWGCAQDLPLEKPALDYVLDTAREDDIRVTLEQGRQALGALGLSGSMALRKISATPQRHLFQLWWPMIIRAHG